MSAQAKNAWKKWGLPAPPPERGHDAHISVLARGVCNGEILHPGSGSSSSASGNTSGGGGSSGTNTGGDTQAAGRGQH